MPGIPAASAAISRTRARSMPNLFSALPVVIFSWVPASTSGLILSAAGARTPRPIATRLSASSSGRDSMLNWRMPASSPAAISASVLPTPANTMRSAGTPAASATRNSPSDTTSAPAPRRASVRTSARLAFALSA